MDFFNEEELREIMTYSKEVKTIISNSVNLKSCQANLELSRKFPKIKLAAGLYPEEALQLNDFDKLKIFIKQNQSSIIAIGEIGLDKLEKADFELQKQVFIKQLDLAKTLNLPAIIHTRKAEKEVLEILENYQHQKIILHCFSGNFKLVKKAQELGFYFSIPAIIIKSEHFQKLVQEVPRKQILTETDSPFLSPYKDKPNQPAYIKETLEKLSELWKIPEKKVEDQIERNFQSIFSTR
jgi:TatD DNase family protein